MLEKRFIRLREVMSITGLSRTSLYELVKQGRFPSPRKPSPRVSLWCSEEILGWMDSLPERNSENQSKTNA